MRTIDKNTFVHNGREYNVEVWQADEDMAKECFAADLTPFRFWYKLDRYWYPRWAKDPWEELACELRNRATEKLEELAWALRDLRYDFVELAPPAFQDALKPLAKLRDLTDSVIIDTYLKLGVSDPDFVRTAFVNDDNPFSLGGLPGVRVWPLYCYQHSGLAMSVKPFSCRWDSGQVGVIVTTDELLSEHGVPLENVEVEAAEFATQLGQYLDGDVYEVALLLDGDVISSRSVIFGSASIDLDEYVKEFIAEDLGG